MNLNRSQDGFTLLELMVVVFIIGVLVSIAVPVTAVAKANAQKKACFANQRTIEGAATGYEAQNNLMAPDIATLVTAQYLRAEPKCPKTGSTYALQAGTADVSACGDAAHGYYQN